MKEEYLSEEEIDLLLEAVDDNPHFREVENGLSMLKCGSERAVLLNVTKKNGVIIIMGDKYTGLCHVSDRHQYSSPHNIWRNTDKESLDNPSKFEPGTLPIVSYSRISDDIFTKENKRDDLNNSPGMFDVYQGISQSKKYRLVTYKETSIMHTLIPLDEKSKNKIINHRRGNCQGLFVDGCVVLRIPYRNKKGEVIYSFEVCRDLNKGIELWYLTNREHSKECLIEEKPLSKELDSIETQVRELNGERLIWVEELILEWKKENNW